MILDSSGRLEALRLDPVGTAPASQPDWSRLFGWAELDMSNFESVDVTPLHGGDDQPVHLARAAWAGRLDGRDVRIEAAAFGRLPVFFRVYEPSSADAARPRFAYSIWLLVGFLAVFGLAALVAARNVRRGRGDVRGAVALGSFLALVATGLGAARGRAELTR